MIFLPSLKKLTHKNEFCSSLIAKGILCILSIFEMKKMKDYQDLYLKYDALLLADVFEKFGHRFFGNYGLYPSHYLSEPSLS